MRCEVFVSVALAREHLRARADELRQHCNDLAPRGFALDGDIDLRTKAGLGKDYEASTVVHKFYPAGSVPDDPALEDDLEGV